MHVFNILKPPLTTRLCIKTIKHGAAGEIFPQNDYKEFLNAFNQLIEDIEKEEGDISVFNSIIIALYRSQNFCNWKTGF